MIVDFEQDPDGPFGSGNFRDDRGRITYLHDPDTASDFVKTLSGSRGGGGGGAPMAKSGGLDVPPEPPGMPGGNAVPAPAPAPAPTPAPGEAAATGIAETEAAVGDLEASVAANAPGAPPTPEQAIAELDATKAKTDAAPGAPAAPAAGSPTPQSVLAELDGVKGKVDPRTVGAKREQLAPRATLGLPPSSVSDSEQVTEAEGRPIDNVLADDAEISGAIEKGDAQILAEARANDKATDAAYGRQIEGTRDWQAKNEQRQLDAQRRQAEAEAEVKTLNAALKENDEKLDPDRHMRQMSGGKKIGMIILAALNGGFGATIGAKNNDVLDIVNAEIERDIDKQKSEIASGKIRLGNDIAEYMRRGMKAEDAELLARDKADSAIMQILDLETKRIGAQGANERAARIMLAPKFEERAVRRAGLLAQGETKRQRAVEGRTIHAQPPVVPGMVVTPQDKLATETLEDRKIQRENAAHVGEVVGHPVSIDEAKEIRNDSQDLGKRLGVGASARATLNQLRTELGLFKGPNGKWQGDADPGSRPLGLSLSDRSKIIDTYYALLKRGDIMSMVREPSALLQNEFAKITERPWLDSQIIQQLDAYEKVIGMAETEARRGFSDEANAYYDRPRPAKKTATAAAPGATKTSGGAKPAPPAAAPDEPAPTAPAAAPNEIRKAPGGLRAE